MININRKGISIVELLGVIGVITILASMWYFASTEAVTTAKATRIITNLRMMTKAAQMWYMDHAEMVDERGKIRWTNDKSKFTGEFADANSSNALIRAQDIYGYLDVGTLSLRKKNASLSMSYYGNGKEWYDVVDSDGGVYQADWIAADPGGNRDDLPRLWAITYTMPTSDAALKKKLADQARSMGLMFKVIGNNEYHVYTYEEAKNAKTITMTAIDFGMLNN